MKNTTHRVVILKNVNSSIISQAILILKDNQVHSEPSVMAEAERVVEKFMHSHEITKQEEKKKLPIWLMSIGAAIGVLALAVSLL